MIINHPEMIRNVVKGRWCVKQENGTKQGYSPLFGYHKRFLSQSNDPFKGFFKKG